MKKKPINDPAFAKLAKSLQSLILSYNIDPESDWTKLQKKQVETLIYAERDFRKVLQKDSRGGLVYKKFIEYITVTRRNILSARPFFRVRQTVFADKISPAIKKRSYRGLYNFDINYTFIVFALKVCNWGPNSKITKAAKVVAAARQVLVELNMPLAISRARIFSDKTPESHLSHMDLVQISFEGLINAIDKFVLPYSPVFRSVIIGRCVGDLIESFSETMLHFYPGEKRKIYRANKAQKFHKEGINYDKLSKEVNSGVPLENPTNPNEIQQLMQASGHLSLNSNAPETGNLSEGEGDTLMDVYQAPDGDRPDVKVENTELSHMLYNGISNLAVVEQKFLKLKGL